MEKLFKEEFELYKSYEPTTIGNCQNYLRLLSDVYFEMIAGTQMNKKVGDDFQEHIAKLTMQMFFTKALSTMELLGGIGYKKNNIELNSIVDHSLLFIIARNYCEMVAAYEVLFLLPNSDEKRKIMENLFLSSGYSYKTQLYSDTMIMENKGQYESEQTIIASAKEFIYSSKYYKSLSPEYQEILDKALERKDYKLKLGNKKVQRLSWQKCLNHFARKNKALEGLYAYLSLHAHPSIIGIEQYNAAFEINDPKFVSLCTTACRYIISFMSMFLQEYIKLFPLAKEIFYKKTDFEKWLLTMYDFRKRK